DRVVEYDPDDLTAGVEAGVRLSELEARTAAHGQGLMLDSPAAARTTIGGLFAAAKIGPRRMSSGAPRDKVLGMTVVLADGTIARTGGRVVKNVSGYDLHRLYTGSLGTLCVLASVHLRLAALPEARRSLLWSSGAVEQAETLLAVLRTSRLDPAALELLDVQAMRAAAARDASLPWRAASKDSGWAVAALYEGDLERVQRAVEVSEGMTPAGAPRPIVL